MGIEYIEKDIFYRVNVQYCKTLKGGTLIHNTVIWTRNRERLRYKTFRYHWFRQMLSSINFAFFILILVSGTTASFLRFDKTAAAFLVPVLLFGLFCVRKNSEVISMTL